MGVAINNGQGSSGQGMGGLMNLFSIFGGGSKKQQQTPSLTADPNGGGKYDPNVFDTPPGEQDPQMPAQQQVPLKPVALNQTGVEDPFMQSLDAIGRKQTKIASGQGQQGQGMQAVSTIASLI